MGTFSKYHRFREAGEQANEVNVERFGTPVRSLFTTSRVFSIHGKTDITDENGQMVYHAENKAFSIRDKTDVTDREGNLAAHIERKVFSLHQRHYVTMGDGLKFELSTELWHLVKDVTNIEGLGWQLRGNIFELNFELYDQSGNIIAVISQKLLSIHDKYCVDIYQADKEKAVVAILVTLQHMIRDRERMRSSSSSSSSSGSN